MQVHFALPASSVQVHFALPAISVQVHFALPAISVQVHFALPARSIHYTIYRDILYVTRNVNNIIKPQCITLYSHDGNINICNIIH